MKQVTISNQNRLFSYVALLFLTILAFPVAADAQSRERLNPTKLTSKDISGVIGDNIGDIYYYSFEAGPGELTITLTVDPVKKLFNTCSVSFEVFNEDARSIGSGFVVASNGETGQRVEHINFSRRQKVTLKIKLPDTLSGLSGPSSGKYFLRLDGATHFGVSQGVSLPDVESDKQDLDTPECLPKKGILRVKMKDGSIRRIDLSEAAEITIQPL
jgi:hypothetical protein